MIAVLGALTITSEYSTGMIRTSLTVQPPPGNGLRGQSRGGRHRRTGRRADRVVHLVLARPGHPELARSRLQPQPAARAARGDRGRPVRGRFRPARARARHRSSPPTLQPLSRAGCCSCWDATPERCRREQTFSHPIADMRASRTARIAAPERRRRAPKTRSSRISVSASPY